MIYLQDPERIDQAERKPTTRRPTRGYGYLAQIMTIGRAGVPLIDSEPAAQLRLFLGFRSVLRSRRRRSSC